MFPDNTNCCLDMYFHCNIDEGEIIMWQDFALSVIGIVFTLMLIPQLLDSARGKAILNYWTCLITGIGCLVMGCVYLTLDLPISAIVSFTTGTMWIAILYYSEKNRKRKIRDRVVWMKKE